MACRAAATHLRDVCAAHRLKADTFYLTAAAAAAAAATEAAAHAQSRSLHLQHPLWLTICSPQAKAKLAKL